MPFFGDPYGTRTHVTTVRGWCLNRLTNGPSLYFAYVVYHVSLTLSIISDRFFAKIQKILCELFYTFLSFHVYSFLLYAQ